MKYKSQLITSACVAALVLSGPSLAFAASKKTASPAPSGTPAATPAATMAPAKAPRAIPFRGKATAIDKKASTFTIAGALKSRVFKVTGKTAVTKMGAPAKFSDLTDGEAVTGSYWKQEDGSLEAKSLKIGGKSETEKEADAAAKAKKDAKKAGADAPKKEAAAPSATPAASPKKK